MSRQCIRCKHRKPLDEFYRSVDNKSGYTAVCKLCKNEKQRARDRGTLTNTELLRQWKVVE